ncbi:hypothetical protein [Amycolatopsis sp. NPDC059021]|uniref:hypothetical protein n=1 Tax=Amycolatopsis sp. NPDC059021 TaxID=3346704 RepID=UPI00366A7D7D
MGKDVMHELKSKSWWDGSAEMWCGLKFKAGKHAGYIFASVSCPACKAAKKAGKR